jgi:hypothetical protein
MADGMRVAHLAKVATVDKVASGLLTIAECAKGDDAALIVHTLGVEIARESEIWQSRPIDEITRL